MKRILSGRARRAPRWIGAVAVAGVLVLVTGCVIELTDELGEFTYVVGVNRAGDRVVTDYGWLTRLDADGTRIRLKAPAGFETAYIVGHAPIDDDGFITGVASSPDGVTIPLLWEPDGTVTDLRQHLPHTNCPNLYSFTPTMSGGGLVVGAIVCGSDPVEPDLRESYVFNRRDQSVRYLPAGAEGKGDIATDVNDAGVVVGFGPDGGVRWTPDGDGYRYEHLDLRPDDINNRGDVLGSNYVDGRSQPYLLRANTATSVRLAPPGGALSIDEGRINDRGMIVVTVYTDGYATRGVRYLTPESAPEPFPGIGGKESYFEALSEQGAAYGQAQDEQNYHRAVLWAADSEPGPQR
jgi:hypothetical protein